MSDLDTRPPEQRVGAPITGGAEQLLITGRRVPLGKTTEVMRVLPDRQVRMIGAWCFLDHYGPEDLGDGPGMRVWAHPHTGLQTVSWLFTGEIDWDLIATHQRDMIQVMLSIQAGRVMPSLLLRKLGTYSRRSWLYRAFRELGRVERTLFLLRVFSSTEVRHTIRAETTKIEA